MRNGSVSLGPGRVAVEVSWPLGDGMLGKGEVYVGSWLLGPFQEEFAAQPCEVWSAHSLQCQLFGGGLSLREPPPLGIELVTGRGRGVKAWTSGPAAGHLDGQYSLQS